MLLCKTSLQFKTSFSVEGLIGITIDDTDIILINIRELINCNAEQVSADKFASKDENFSLPQPQTDDRKLDNCDALQQYVFGSASNFENSVGLPDNGTAEDEVEKNQKIVRTSGRMSAQGHMSLQQDSEENNEDLVVMIKEEEGSDSVFESNQICLISPSLDRLDLSESRRITNKGGERWAPLRQDSRIITAGSVRRGHISPNQSLPSVEPVQIIGVSREQSGYQSFPSKRVGLHDDDVIVKKEHSSMESYDMSKVNEVASYYRQEQPASCSTFDSSQVSTLPYHRDRNPSMTSAQHYATKRGKVSVSWKFYFVEPKII